MGTSFLTGTTLVRLAMTTAGATLCLLQSFAIHSPAQQVFSTRSELVILHVVVTDRKGAYVSHLPADAFTVLEDGQQQSIQFFGKQDTPVTAGLLIDNSGSMLTVRERRCGTNTCRGRARHLALRLER